MNDQRYWLFAAVDPDTDRLLHVRLFATRTQALIEMFLTELREKHLGSDAIFLVDGAPWLQATCHRHSLRFQHVTYRNRAGGGVSDDDSPLQPVCADDEEYHILIITRVLICISRKGESGDIETDPSKLPVVPGGYLSVRPFYTDALRLCPR